MAWTASRSHRLRLPVLELTNTGLNDKCTLLQFWTGYPTSRWLTAVRNFLTHLFTLSASMLAEIDRLDQKIKKSAHAQRQIAALADIDGVYLFDIARIAVFKNR